MKTRMWSSGRRGVEPVNEKDEYKNIEREFIAAKAS